MPNSLPSVAAAIGALILGGGVLLLQGRLVTAREAATAQGAAHSAAHGLDRAISHSMAATYSLALDVHEEHWSPDGFDATAAQLASWYPDVDCFQLAPDGVVRYAYPLAGHEAAIGHDLLGDPERRAAAAAAIDSGELTLAGPPDLVQGGRGVIGRLPVRVGHGDDERFWGFAIALVGLDTLAESLHSSLDEAGWAWEVWHNEPGSGERSTVLMGSTPVGERPVQVGVTVPNGAWVLDLTPAEGWSSGVGPLGWVGVMLLALMAGSMVELRRRAAERLTHLAFHDPLTGLSNRVVLEHSIVKAVAQARRTRTLAAVAVVDVDDFKEVNDQHGHATGDEVLVEVGKRLQQTVRAVDSVIRLGGDEFALVVTDLGDREDAEVLCRRVMASLSQPMEVRRGQISISASVGAAIHRGDSDDPADLLRLADEAMYRAKNEGKNRIELSGLYALDIDEALAEASG